MFNQMHANLLEGRDYGPIMMVESCTCIKKLESSNYTEICFKISSYFRHGKFPLAFMEKREIMIQVSHRGEYL